MALRRGEVRVAAAGARSIALARLAAERRAIVAVNAGEDTAELDLSSSGGGEGLRWLELAGTEARLTDGGGAIVLPALGSAVLVS